MDSVIEFIKKGEKHQQTEEIGLEIEHFVLHKETGNPMPYEIISELMESLSPMYPVSVYEQGHRISLENESTLITLEPGCQLEMSFRYTSDLDWLEEKYEEAIAPVRRFVEEKGYRLVYSGGIPTVSVDRIQRIEKERYHLMEEYFKTSGTRGLEMMKGTAAVHVSIDYAQEEDFVRKVRAANILHPIFMFLSFDTPVYAGKKNEDVLLRDSIWHHTDQQRCRIIPDLFEEGFGYASYVNYVMETPMILMHENDEFISVGNKTGREVAEQYGLSEDAISHYFSMVFPDIRVKQFIEIRSADCMPIEDALAYCALIKGLMYKKENVDQILSLTASIQDIETAKQNIRKDKWDAKVYHHSMQELCMNLIQMARSGLDQDESKRLDRWEQRIKERRFIADREQ